MRVLQLCHRVPYPPADGGSIAMHQITEGLLKRRAVVKVLALSPTQLQSDLDQIDPDYLKETGFEAIPIDTKIHIFPAFLNLFSNKSYNIERFRSQAMNDKIIEVLTSQTFDIIQLEGLYLAPFIPLLRKYSKAPILFRSHNIEHFIWVRLAQTCRNPLRKVYLQLLANRLKKYETQIIHKIDGLIAISEIDRAFFCHLGYKGPSVVIPAGMPAIRLPEQTSPAESLSVFHLGSMDWRPNQEGIIWFLKKVWPLVTEKRKDVTFYLAGKRMPDYFYQYASEQVVVLGEVDDAIHFLLSKNLMVVPLLSGGGMRVKIIEGMAAAKTIISTHIGAEGIGCQHEKHIFLADEPNQMADWILFCLNNPKLSKEIGLQARQFAIENYSMDTIMQNLLTFYNGFYS